MQVVLPTVSITPEPSITIFKNMLTSLLISKIILFKNRENLKTSIKEKIKKKNPPHFYFISHKVNIS